MSTIKIQQITKADDPALTRVHTLYHNSFPKEERRPWELLVNLIETQFPYFKLLAAHDEAGSFVGFITLWNLPTALYVEHLAVEPSLRGSGSGGIIIDEAIRLAGDLPLVLEVELPETGPDAPRRIAFYKRHGFEAMEDYTYFQPPYAPGLPDVQLMLMTTRPLADPNEFVIQLHTIVYNQ